MRVGSRFGWLRARLALVGDANDGRRGGCRKGLDEGCTGEEVLRRFLGGSSIATYVLVGVRVSTRGAIECLAVLMLVSRDASRVHAAMVCRTGRLELSSGFCGAK